MAVRAPPAAFVLVALLLAGCASPSAPPERPAPGVVPVLRCAHDPCSQVVLPAEENAEEPFVAVDPADAAHVVVVAPVNNHPNVTAFRWLGFATTFDRGATWTRGFVTLDLAGADPGVAYNIASDAMVAFANDGTVVVTGLAWGGPVVEQGSPPQASRPTAPDIAAWRSTDGGTTFPDGRVLSKALGVASPPSGLVTAYEDRDFLAVDRATGKLYLTWSRLTGARVPMVGGFQTSDVYLATSEDAGASWREPARIAEQSLYGTAIAALEDTVLVIGRDGAAGEYRYLRSTDGGASWSAPATLGPASSGNYNAPSPALWRAGDELHAAVAAAQGEGYAMVVLYRSADGGATWGDAVLVTQDKATTKRHPTLATEPNSTRAALTFYDSGRGTEDDLDVLLLMLEDGQPAGTPATGQRPRAPDPPLRLTEATNAPKERLMDYMGLGLGPGGGFAAWDDREGEALRIRGAAFLLP